MARKGGEELGEDEMRYLIIAFLFFYGCGGSGSDSNIRATDNFAPEIRSVAYYEWWDVFSNGDRAKPLTEFFEGDLVVWEVCSTTDPTTTTSLEFLLFYPTPFVGNPYYRSTYGPFPNFSDFRCFTNFDRSKAPLGAAWVVEGPFGEWLLSWRVIDGKGRESFPVEEIFRISR